MKQMYVYVLQSVRDKGFYIGKTNDVGRRLAEHNGGHTSSTKARRPFIVAKVIPCNGENEARKIEKELKKGYKREELKRQLSFQRRSA